MSTPEELPLMWHPRYSTLLGKKGKQKMSSGSEEVFGFPCKECHGKCQNTADKLRARVAELELQVKELEADLAFERKN